MAQNPASLTLWGMRVSETWPPEDVSLFRVVDIDFSAGPGKGSPSVGENPEGVRGPTLQVAPEER